MNAQPRIAAIVFLVLQCISQTRGMSYAFVYEQKGIVAESVSADEMRITAPFLESEIRIHRSTNQTAIEFADETVRIVNALAKSKGGK